MYSNAGRCAEDLLPRIHIIPYKRAYPRTLSFRLQFCKKDLRLRSNFLLELQLVHETIGGAIGLPV